MNFEQANKAARYKSQLKISRTWAMPNSRTFEIEQIKDLISRWLHGHSIDPFSNGSKLATVTNDIDPQYDTHYHMDALEFIESIYTDSVDTVLFDPPYSPRQVSEVYKSLDMSVNMQTTQSSFWGDLKREIARVVKHNGIVITCGWHSGGIGEQYGFEIQEILLVAHGGWHNDTIVTVEKKVADQQDLFK